MGSDWIGSNRNNLEIPQGSRLQNQKREKRERETTLGLPKVGDIYVRMVFLWISVCLRTQGLWAMWLSGRFLFVHEGMEDKKGMGL